MAAFDIVRSIRSVVRMSVLLGVEAGGHRDLQLNVELPLAFGVDRDDDRLADGAEVRRTNDEDDQYAGGADDHQEGSGDNRYRNAHVSYQRGARS
jgi:hypothetical protein